MHSILRRLLTLFLSALIPLLSACHHDGATPIEVANPEDPVWIHQATPHNKVAVVFVHGVFGSTRGTWTNANGHSFFEFLQNAPDFGSKVDVYAFGFTSNMFRDGSLNVREAATKLDDYLEHSGAWDYDTVVFVAHSMGGLVVMRLLTSRQARLEQVPLVALYATPQEGAQIAAIGHLLASNNAALAQMVPADGNDFLKGLDEDWKLIPPTKRPAIVCAYETVPTYGVPIVTSVSATRYCDSAPLAVGGADHLSIVKPDRQEHDSVVKLLNALKQYVFGSQQQVLLQTPDFTTEGDKWVYAMHDTHGGNARLVNNGRRTIHYTVGPPSGTKLAVLPTTPRDIAPGQTENLSMAFLLYGEWTKEYAFKFSAPALEDRTVVVRLDSVPTDDAREHGAASDVATAVEAYLKAPDTAAHLKTLSPLDQQEQIVKVAEESVRAVSPGSPDAMRLLLAADALSLAGLTDLSATALRKLERQAPDVIALPSAQAVAAEVSSQNEMKTIFLHTKTPDPKMINQAWKPRAYGLDAVKKNQLSEVLVHTTGLSGDVRHLQTIDPHVVYKVSK